LAQNIPAEGGTKRGLANASPLFTLASFKQTTQDAAYQTPTGGAFQLFDHRF
jgi:hypothetical protein